ncbi:MAG: DUF1934 domain-containing protein [Bacillota bacterium]|nr:DUF1934 domain-containing protein [Bacillota bacterium]
MEPNVLLTINGQQWSGHEQPQVIRLTTEGNLYRRASAWYVVYEESSATGMEGTQTTMQVSDDGSVVLTRTGSHEMRLTFLAGSRHITRMNTPYGDLDVAVYTSLVQSEIDEKGGYIQLGYTIDFNNRDHLNTRLDVKIRHRAS